MVSLQAGSKTRTLQKMLLLRKEEGKEGVVI
jgi:hypothetical protein